MGLLKLNFFMSSLDPFGSLVGFFRSLLNSFSDLFRSLLGPFDHFRSNFRPLVGQFWTPFRSIFGSFFGSLQGPSWRTIFSLRNPT